MSAPDAIRALLERGVAEHVFPSAQACVWHQGKRIIEVTAGPVEIDTRFDLASLTKVLCTTPVFLSLWRDGKLGPETPLARFFPESPASKAGVVLADLLYHRSGLPAFVPFFARAMPAVPELFKPDCPASVRADVRAAVVEAAAKVNLRSAPGTEAVYSDVGFILLGEALSAAGGAPLDALFRERVADRLELGLGFHRLSRPLERMAKVAPTGTTRPRAPAPGQENMWPAIPIFPGSPGEVDDDNAWVLDGVSGHAGLFGTAAEVARLGQAVLDGIGGSDLLTTSPLWRRAAERDTTIPSSERALGFDTPGDSNPSCGHAIAASRPRAIGHLAFTGCSLWIDRARALSISLCTNRVALGRENVAIRGFRPHFHDAILEALGLAGVPS